MTLEWSQPARIPANEPLLRAFYRDARHDLSADSSWWPDGWQLRSHPDLVDGLIDLASHLDAEPVYAYGRFCLSHLNGLIFVFVSGNAGFEIHLPRKIASRAEIETRGSWLGLDDWCFIRPWSPDLSPATVADRLRGLLTEAHEAASSRADWPAP